MAEMGDKDMGITQISLGGLENNVTAKMLSDYLEDNVGIVWRCRVKTSSTPQDSYPSYEIDTERVQRKIEYEKVVPHAFVHFAVAHSSALAIKLSGSGDLRLGRNTLKVSMGPQNPFRLRERRRTTAPYKVPDVSIEIGAMKSRDEFVVGWRGPRTGVDFLVDPFNGTCQILFTKDTAFSLRGEARPAVIKCNFKIEFVPREINEIKRYKDFSSLVVLFQLASSPQLYYRTADDDIEVSVPFDLLDDDDPWIRTADFVPSGAIGRCNTYRISARPRNLKQVENALGYLQNRRVPIVNSSPQERLRVQDEPDFGVPMSDPFFCFEFKEGLNFKVMFMVNAVVHKGIINQHQMSKEFFDLLRSQSEELNLVALKHMYSYKRPIYDAYRALDSVRKWLIKNPKLLQRPEQMDDVVEVRRLVITPSKAYCLPPEVELSNRVLRNYKNISDRFLRVTFMDEAMQTLNKNVLTYYAAPIVREITSNLNPQRTTMFKRVRDILYNGFHLCGRRYSFLAFSSNQLRDRSAWFFAEDSNTSVDLIKKWMGKFTDRNVAKCAARMGQCFSSTYATVEVPFAQINSRLPDVVRNDYVFSDGIGMISVDLAKEVAEKLQLNTKQPCAYQIRYAGFKGVVACWPAKNNGPRLQLRPSMKKFDSVHTTLEICSWTRFQPGFLNRQIVTLLSALEVHDEKFWRMQELMVSRLDRILEDPDMAFDVLTASCTDQGNTAAMMLAAGFRSHSEPHLRGMLTSIRVSQLGDLREKSRIFVHSGRWLMGCLDELGALEYGQCFIQVSKPSLEDCFANHGSAFSETKKNLEVIKGLVVIAKNPCLHPGDVRILEAVDVPGLHHLYDCLVFPQKGERPHANEASGSDLDGDLYFVTWDDTLIPPSKRSWTPMDYEPGEVKRKPREVTHSDIIEFFTKNMVNESLGTICNAHVVHADLSESGALDEKCIKLAELAAIAVDFPKTGKIVSMPPDLKPQMYPDFMGKEELQSYKSAKILGKLYRRVRDAYDLDYEASSQLTYPAEHIFYDQELEVAGSKDFIADAWSCKCSYDGQLIGLLGQYKVNSEDEVVTGHIWSMPKFSSKKQGELKERLKHAYSALRKDYRKIFECMGPEFDQLPDHEKNALYEQKASAWYEVTYHESWVKKSKELQEMDDSGKTVLLSFAWIAADYLARMKIRRRRMENAISNKPIDSLGRYLADKI
ncbi:RNA-dependent RNA polymerase 6 [Salvia hispanica]|uniref:RNA-dependent RNA polymerase 6 n=1 Tax=Salvia hispanica TaxID=49212 RepID=UPI0020090ADE|nr:RNA-dependent RNA polymerase 6 [Salvia hispanica]XP_047972266.1 RNA-dependent RNA polymerase 6 [Salvia hispanica]